MVKVAAILLTGTVLFAGTQFRASDVAVEQDGALPVARATVENTEDIASGLAGISGVVEENLDVDADAQNELVASGVSLALMEQLITSDADADVAETGVSLSTTAETTQSLYGYTNLGIAQVDGNLNIRTEPSTEASLVGKLPNNAGCEILGVEGEWSHISSGEVEGYVKSEYLLSGDAAAAKAAEVIQTLAKVTTTTLYVREEPNTDCSIITSMPLGEELEVIEQLDGWVKVNVDSDEGYVSADYVEISTQLTTAMTMTEVRYGQGVSDVRVSLVQYATQFVGNPYVWGGTSLTKGADCSGFVLSVFAKYGVSLPHSSKAQANYGTKISASEAQPGDLFFYGSGKGINHVAIYIGGGQVVHASSPKSGIKISSAYYRTPVKVVRILN
jgi:cell wall-associated NlpC family hydrolase